MAVETGSWHPEARPCEGAAMSRYAQGPGEWERDETPGERLDRNWGEVLQELRVTQTAIQILSASCSSCRFNRASKSSLRIS